MKTLIEDVVHQMALRINKQESYDIMLKVKEAFEARKL